MRDFLKSLIPRMKSFSSDTIVSKNRYAQNACLQIWYFSGGSFTRLEVPVCSCRCGWNCYNDVSRFIHSLTVSFTLKLQLKQRKGDASVTELKKLITICNGKCEVASNPKRGKQHIFLARSPQGISCYTFKTCLQERKKQQSDNT